MILPIFLGLPSYRQIVTWLLVILNIAFYLHFSADQDLYAEKINTVYEDDVFIRTQGHLYAQIIDRNPNEASQLIKTISVSALKGRSESQMTLGRLAFRSPLFKKYAEDFNFVGDQVQYTYWKSSYSELLSLQKQDPSFWMGVSSISSSWKSLVSYQFLHGGFFHLISNLWFLLIFGYFLERLLGSFRFLCLYIFGGVFAAMVFQQFSGLSIAPLIGASGSISCIMGFVLTLYWNKNIRAFYWLLPAQGYHGIKKIPSKLVFVMWILSDVAGYMSTMEEFGGVAHAAHVGGFIFGITCAFVWLAQKRLLTLGSKKYLPK